MAERIVRLYLSSGVRGALSLSLAASIGDCGVGFRHCLKMAFRKT